MKKIGLVILFFIVLLSLISIVYAEKDCELAVPRYGVIECYNMGNSESKSISLNHLSDHTTGSFSCISNCKLNTQTDIPSISCGGFGTHLEIRINGELKYEESSTGSRQNFNIEFDRRDELSFLGYCRTLLGQKKPLPISSIIVHEDVIMLKEGWAGTLPTKTIPNTQGCSLNKVMDEYEGDRDVSNYLNPETGKEERKPSSTYSSVNNMPSNWEVGENYIFVKDWETGIADISLTYDKDTNAYWCGGDSGNRKLYSVEEITSKSGNCYAIPTSVKKSKLECCFPSDCSWKGSKYTCNPDTWKCEDTRWCDSQLDCDQVFGEGVCDNRQIISWECDFSEPWGDHKGTCEKKTRSVVQCPEDCTSNEYYNDEEGICKARVTILDCPVGKCCEAGGSYKPKECYSDLVCCRPNGALVGDCKVSCEEKKEEALALSEVTGYATKESNSGSFLWLFIVIILVIVGVVAFFYFKREGLFPRKEEETNKKTSKKSKKTIYCEKCGAEIERGDGFCTGCGKKM